MFRSVIVIFFLSLVACSSPSIVATKAIQQGDAANNQNQYDAAIKHYEEYLTLSPQLGLYRNPRMEADVNRKLAHAYATQGKYRQSINCLKKALTMDSVNNNKLEFTEDYRQLGMVFGYTGDLQSSKKYLQKSLVLNEGLEKSLKDSKRSSAADTYMSLAHLELTLGNFKSTNELAQKALEIYEKIPGEFIGVIEAKLILGIVNRETGKLDLALSLILQSQQLSEQNKLSKGRHAQALSEIYFLKGDPENAIRNKLLALEEAERTNIKPQMIIACMRLGDGYQRLGDPVRANYYYRKALAIQATIGTDTLGSASSFDMRLGDVKKAHDYYLQSGSALGLALVSLRLGEQYFQNNDLDSAQLMFEQAQVSFKKSESNEGIAKANIELAKVLIAKKQFTQAQKLLLESNQLTIQSDLKWQIFLRKGIINESQGSFDSALFNYKKSIDIINEMRSNLSIEEFKTLFTNTKIEVYDRMIMLLLNNHKKLFGYTPEKALFESFAFNEQSRSRTFLDMLGNRKIEAKSSADTELMEEEQLLKIKIQRLTGELNKSNQPAMRHQLTDELYHAQDSYDKLMHKIKLGNESYSMVTNVEPPPLQAIQARLDDQTVVVEYWISGEALVIWTISKNKVSYDVVPVSKIALNREVMACRKAISLQAMDLAESSSKNLNRLLINPILDNITGFKNLVIVPHRDLHFLPFQALQSDANKFLIEQYVISYAPSASVLYYCLNRKPATGDKFLGLALGDLPIGNFSGLPGTETEINQLAEMYPGMTSKSEEAFSETYLKAHAHDQNYIHMATHGVLNKEQPLYSYLLMSSTDQDDGRLTVDEIFSMELKAKIVTLSACETALGEIGEGDDLVGLSRAFIYAGSPGVIVSLWQVDDATTAWLMTRFHQYMRAGYNASEALTYAQRDIIQRNFVASKSRGLKSIELLDPIQKVSVDRNNASARNPYYWAPFVIIGNGLIK